MTEAAGVGIWGVGHALPDHVLTNHDLEKMVETTDEWIRTRTGISERRIADEDTATSDLALRASQQALERAGVAPEELDLIIVATVTPDMSFPSTACLIQHALGASNAAAFDLEAACSGFMYALSVARGLIASDTARLVLVVGAETLSKITDWTDRDTCVLLGDGAGACILGPCRRGAGILSTHLGADGGGGDLLYMPAGGSRRPASRATLEGREHYLKMNGREVFKFAVSTMGDAALKAVCAADLQFEDVDWYIPHQANIRIIEASARKFGLPMDRVYVNLDRCGNTSSASIPIALAEGWEKGLFTPGQNLLLVAFGGGLTWGSAVVRWIGEEERVV